MTDIKTKCDKCNGEIKLIKEMNFDCWIGTNFGQVTIIAELECGHSKDMSWLLT